MTDVSIKEAARLVGKSRQSINEATRQGVLSYKLDPQNRKRIEISELQRVYDLVMTMDELMASNDVQPDKSETSTQSSSTEEGLDVLKVRLEMAESERDMVQKERDRERKQLESEIENLRSSLEKAQEQGSKAMLLLTDQSQKGESRGLKQREEVEQMRETLTKVQRQNKALYKKLKAQEKRVLFGRFFG